MCDQDVEIHNLGGKRIRVSMNGTMQSCPPGGRAIASIKRAVDPSRKEFFAPGFLREPKVTFRRAPTPY